MVLLYHNWGNMNIIDSANDERFVIKNNYTLILETGVVQIEFEPRTAFTMKTATDLINDRIGLEEGSLRPTLINIENIINACHKALFMFFTQLQTLSTSCMVLLVNDEKSNIIAGAIKGGCVLELPCEIFKSARKASNWMDNYKLF